jgi:hypothetical protein
MDEQQTKVGNGDMATQKVFTLFPRLPSEIQSTIWQKYAESVLVHGRVHRIGVRQNESRIEFLPTRELAVSTFPTRHLLKSNPDCRFEVLSFMQALPSTMALENGTSLIRCDLSRDIFFLDESLDSLFERISEFRPETVASIKDIRCLGIGPCTERWDREKRQWQEVIGNPSVPESVYLCSFVRFLASFPRLEAIYLMQPAAALSNEFLRIKSRHEKVSTPFTFFLGDDQATEWFSTQSIPGWYEDEEYQDILNVLTRTLVCLTDALRRPEELVRDSGLEPWQFERLKQLKVHVLRQYRDAEFCDKGQGMTWAQMMIHRAEVARGCMSY